MILRGLCAQFERLHRFPSWHCGFAATISATDVVLTILDTIDDHSSVNVPPFCPVGSGVADRTPTREHEEKCL